MENHSIWFSESFCVPRCPASFVWDGALCVAEVCEPACTGNTFCQAGECVSSSDMAPSCSTDTCASRSLACGTFVNDCGERISCGGCEDGLTCVNGECACVSQRGDAEWCQILNRECGTALVSECDASGSTSRNVDCGNCDAPKVCGLNGIEGVCGCPPLTDAQEVAQWCAAEDAECGEIDVVDECGQSQRIDCGGCPMFGDSISGLTCGESEPNRCSCPSEHVRARDCS